MYTVRDAFSASALTTKNYSSTMKEVTVNNFDASAFLTLIVNNISVTVGPSEVFNGEFEPFTNVTINATALFGAVVKG
jgi:hypothetical protein